MKKIAMLLGAVALAAGLALSAAGARNVAPKNDAGAKPAAFGAVEAAAIVRDGEYTGKDEVAAYVRKFSGALPKNFITKRQARDLGWQGGPLEPYAPGKSIGGDRFGNYERRLPVLKNGFYKECDIDTKGRPRGAKRLVFTSKGSRIYYTEDHYETFKEVK